MATSTTNYQLSKPDPSENVNVVTDLNDNYNKIDQDMNRQDVQIFTATGTWTKPARCKRVKVQVVGAGGGSGGVGATSGVQLASAGGGGGGGYAEKLFLASALSSTEAVSVGVAGVAGTNAPGNGGTGGLSDFANGKAYVVAGAGGLGGLAGIASGGILNAVGGAGGVGSGGDWSTKGGCGGTGLVLSATTAYVNNFGGMTFLAGMAIPPGDTGSGSVGISPGGGASGALNNISQAARVGSVGAAGLVIVTNYY